jgi:WD40 repeat protein
VARATAAVFVGGRRVGSAVLVAPRYLVTAAHVLLHQDVDTLAKVTVDQVELEFPGQELGGQPGRAPASRLDLGPAELGVDAAVLDLGEDRPGWLPAPVPVWPAARTPGRVQVFGYPLAEGSLNGVWRQFMVAGPAAAGTVQLDWIGEVGTFPGHSGGPVIDADGHALAGILVEGSDRGRFDRFLPVTLIARVWPELPRPWLMTGTDPGEARSHFTRRARGQRSAARGGDLFRGRRVALDRIREWLTADEPPGQPLVVIGQPGAGKSAVVARAALSVEAEHGGAGLAFHARAATTGGFLAALADLTGVDTPASADELVTALDNLPGQPPIRVVVDALDEAASDLDRRQITEALAELAVLPGLRVAVATRPLAAGDPYAPGGLLPSLGVMTRDGRSLVDLDSDIYFELDDLHRFAAVLLAQDGMDHPGPAGAAWTQYRSQHPVRDRLAAVIAQRAGRNFLVTAMAAVPLSTAPNMIDPNTAGFDPSDIPSGVGEALSKYLDRLAEHRRERDRGLLTALAYARGAGLDDPDWLAFAAALGYDASVADLDALRRSPAADYLLQTTTTERGARPVTRLFHQALTDQLLAVRDQPSDESVLLDMLLDQGKRTAWQDRYLREHVAEHAASADRLDQLLDDPLYLFTADPARLVPQLDKARSALARATAAVYRQIAQHLVDLDRPARASQLELTAHRLGCRSLAARIADAAPDRPWQTRWSHGPRATGHQVLTGRTGSVTAVAAGALPDGTQVIISSGDDGTVRMWRLADGTPLEEPPTGHHGGVNAVAAATLPDGTPVIASGGDDGTVRVWRLADSTPVGEPLTGHHGPVRAVAAGALPDGTPVIISGGDDGTVRVWRLADGAPVGEPLTGHPGGVNAVAAGALPDGTPVIISCSWDWTVRLWRLADGTPVGEPLTGHHGPVTAVAAGTLPDGTPVIVSGGVDGTVRVWRLADGSPVGEPLVGFTSAVNAVAVGALPDGTPVIVSGGAEGETGGDDGPVRVWRLADGAPVGEPLTGHHGAVRAVAVGALPDGTPVIISGGWDGTVRVWRLADTTPGGEPLGRHTRAVRAVAAGALPDGIPVIISGGADGTVRVWRLADGAPVGKPLTGHVGRVSAVAVGALPDGTPVIISSSDDLLNGTVRVWRLADGVPVGEPLRGGWLKAVAVGALPVGTPVIVSGGHDGTVRVWRLADGATVGKPLTSHHGTVMAVAVGALPDGTPVIVSGGHDWTVRVWRLVDGAPVGEPLTQPGWVNAVAVGALPDGTPVIVSGSDDGTVRVWRLADGAPVGAPLTGHRFGVNAVAVGALPDGTPVIVSGSDDGTVRVWRLADGTQVVPPLDLTESVLGVAVHGNVIVTAAGADIAVHQPALPQPNAVAAAISANDP